MKKGPPEQKAINFYGNDARQIAARRVFPILIQLATDSNRPTITYGELADKIGKDYLPGKLKDPKNTLDAFRAQWMRNPLGCIWQTLFEHQQDSNIEIPYLMTIVVNKNTNLPTIFETHLTWSEKKIKSEQDAVYKFEQWPDIMEAINQK